MKDEITKLFDMRTKQPADVHITMAKAKVLTEAYEGID